MNPSTTPTAKASDIAYLRLSRGDLDASESFFLAFGLRTVRRTETHLWMRATGTAPYALEIEKGKDQFLGIGLIVEDQDLDALATLPAALGGRMSISGPGGGEFVRLKMPSGFTVDGVAGQTPVSPLPARAALTLNTGESVSRLNRGQRPDLTAPNVIRLGHTAIEVVDFQANLEFVTKHFGMITSDFQELADGTPVAAFNRFNCGAKPTDHHSVVFVHSFDNRLNHAAFECLDLDSVAAGNILLRNAGYRHAWGIGRHILGSQIFDYWQDDSGAKFEHYTDGDVFDSKHPTERHRLNGNAHHQWGPALPKAFLDAGMTPARLIKTIRNIRNSNELTFSKLLAIKKAASE